jgi:hypothetical protein
MILNSYLEITKVGHPPFTPVTRVRIPVGSPCFACSFPWQAKKSRSFAALFLRARFPRLIPKAIGIFKSCTKW